MYFFNASDLIFLWSIMVNREFPSYCYLLPPILLLHGMYLWYFQRKYTMWTGSCPKKGQNLVPTYELTILSVNLIIFSFVSFLLSCMNYKTITCNKFNSTLLQLLLCLLKISLRGRRSFAQTSPTYPDNNATVLCKCLTVRTPKRLLWQPPQ